ncbi:uncharacterized protein EV420DRAFT_1478780 [Desarmillaria tabescens]|uniref:Uncharacterized protein n=1 Tax=Armillaria tabescens TaxID=1929756 RepID=A0AA39N7B5_ARMTA|nr:uncharacterized protein EV420DRAFT_1478780 [Desarmillaria tabescens]KAK0460264.1 hypothetical protein EV420DRAFT_1478780 [Desarmillaria tabescens]
MSIISYSVSLSGPDALCKRSSSPEFFLPLMPKSPTKSQSKTKAAPRSESLLQQETRLKKEIPSWLWKACIPIARDDKTDPEYPYSATSSSEKRRMAIHRMQDLEDAEFHRQYPPRPEAEEMKAYSEPMSEPMKALKELVDASPVAKGRYEFTADEEQYVYFHHDMFSGSKSWGWRSEYEQRIKDALDVVKKEHGQNELMVARWAVRDKRAECVGGITGNSAVHCYQWSDDSVKWLGDNPSIECHAPRRLVKR